MTAILVRFAPSPTGRIHVGNVRTALFNLLFARAGGGRVLLRIDDTDTDRSRKAYEDAILADLAWLGLAHDLFLRQSERFALYREAAERLKAAGRLYPCYETAEELERKRKRQLGRGQAPVYDRAALTLTDRDRIQLEAAGRKPHWRFLLERESVAWDDLIRGPSHVDLASVSDPVLIRSDGHFLYTLPSVADDIDTGITHIIRGEDHVTNTGAQIALFKALGGAPPAFAHHPLLLAADGGPLSKRLGSLSIGELREAGFEPMALLSLLARLGTSDPLEPRSSLDALVRDFDFAKIGRAPARFDLNELRSLSAKLLHEMPYEAVKDRLGLAGPPERLRAFWEAVRPNLAVLADAGLWWRVVEGPVEPVIEDRALTEKAAGLLPPPPFTEESWGVFTKAVSAATGAKGRALFQPLRLALTGRGDGPELKKLLVLIGPERAKARLSGQTA